MDLQLSEKVAVVTGAGGGIGLAVVRRLVEEGARVVAGSLHVTAELTSLASGGAVTPVEVDLSTPSGPAELVAAAGGVVDVLVNNVGIARTRPGGFLEVGDDDWATTWNLNVMAAVRACRAAIPLMLASGGGAIVNTGSINARLPDPLVIDYSSSKAALVNLAKSLSKAYAAQGIRVNTVDPGPVATALWLGDNGVAAQVAQAQGGSASDVAAAAAAGMPTGRFTTPGEVADLVAFLASPLAGNITGTDVVIDGGMAPML